MPHSDWTYTRILILLHFQELPGDLPLPMPFAQSCIQVTASSMPEVEYAEPPSTNPSQPPPQLKGIENTTFSCGFTPSVL
ncbi:hypothetical protein LENED_003734 [Lentinula edodes]|uniref:Uncharacterized protein n=1 Tax=Lentinula edodes TaxID=5353 RepID=A0A1Q3E4D2_LENED|nr:hypothetical protein LENED_003734 [Lentinula edodes]